MRLIDEDIYACLEEIKKEVAKEEAAEETCLFFDIRGNML